MRRAKCFGINLARLDIRQEADRHEKLLNEIFKKKKKIKFSSLTEIEKVKLLLLNDDEITSVLPKDCNIQNYLP